MILKGSQRGNAKKLALHLLNEADNDFVEVHEVTGFLSYDVTGAFKEIQSISKGTRCRQPFFSVSLSPPADAIVTIEMFEAAADRIANANSLAGQPRVIVFHEKEGRRHAHLVISRIDAETMTAINLSHFKNKLQQVSRDLYLEHQWKLPPGLRDRSLKSPTNVTFEEWQAAKRRGKNAIDQKKLIQQCWAVGDNKAGFETALKDYGYLLAKGNRRSHVIVCHDGEVLAVTRAIGLKAKVVRERLGEPGHLPSVEDALAQHVNDVRGQFVRMAGTARREFTQQRSVLEKQRKELIARHRSERATLDNGQTTRWSKESAGRAVHYKTGIGGLWQRLSGQRRQIDERNANEAYMALQRDRTQRQRLIEEQLKEQAIITRERTRFRQQGFGLFQEMRSDRDQLIAKLAELQPRLTRRHSTRERSRQNQDLGPSLEL